MANRKTKNNTQLQEEWIRRKYVVPVNIMESENNLILVILLFCITGCKEKRPAIKEAVFEFNPNNILVCDTLDINQICDNFRYIPLETRD